MERAALSSSASTVDLRSDRLGIWIGWVLCVYEFRLPFVASVAFGIPARYSRCLRLCSYALQLVSNPKRSDGAKMTNPYEPPREVLEPSRKFRKRRNSCPICGSPINRWKSLSTTWNTTCPHCETKLWLVTPRGVQTTMTLLYLGAVTSWSGVRYFRSSNNTFEIYFPILPVIFVLHMVLLWMFSRWVQIAK